MTMTSLAQTLNNTIAEPFPASKHRILVMAKNQVLQRNLQQLLCSKGYEVEIVADDGVCLEMLRKRPPSALILDLRYTASVRWELCHEITQSAPDVPFVILSGNYDVMEKILLLEIGADEYLPLSFQPQELLARVRSLIRRALWRSRKQTYVFENVVVDFASMDVTRDGEKIPLTTKEFKTLEFMMKHAYQVVSRDELLTEVWAYRNYPCTRTIDNHILKLRQKLENDPAEPRHFLTIHGVGFKFAP
jgi:DNA-binding response OmpR family regulator